MMPPETRRFLRQNLRLVHDADLRAEVQDLPEGDNIAAPDNSDAARIAQTWCQMKDEEEAARSASRALGWWVVAVLIVASVAVGMVVGHFAVKALANAAVTVVQAERMEGW
jgi:hypothetical protein